MNIQLYHPIYNYERTATEEDSSPQSVRIIMPRVAYWGKEGELTGATHQDNNCIVYYRVTTSGGVLAPDRPTSI